MSRPATIPYDAGAGVTGLRRVLVDGALVVLPAGALALLVASLTAKLQVVATPLAGGYAHPVLAAALLLVLLCLLVGLLVQSTAGRRARRAVEAALFQKIPGYRLLKAFGDEAPLSQDGGRVLRPALAAIEEGHCPALVMDELADGRLLVFVPGSPAPMSGALYLFTPDRVIPLDVPLLPFLRAIASWGLGLREMLEADAAAAVHAGAGNGSRHQRHGAA